jgi:cell wall assembly regulator SMI1
MTAKLARLLDLITERTGLRELPLRPGASPSRVQRLERHLATTLPEHYREMLRCFNGQEIDPALMFAPEEVMFIDDAEVLELWTAFGEHRDDDFIEELQDEGRVRCVLYHPGRIPIAYNELAGRYLCLDQIPGPRGRVDQLVVNVNEIDCVVVEDDLAAWIGRLAWLLETGKADFRRQPPEYGAGYWFESAGRHIDFFLYRELTASSPDLG